MNKVHTDCDRPGLPGLRRPIHPGRLFFGSLLALLASCGGGGGGGGGGSDGGVGPTAVLEVSLGVIKGYDPLSASMGLNFTDGGGDSSGGVGGDGSAGGDGGGDGGGAGAGAGLGAFVNATVKVERSDGTELGVAVTNEFGMVSIKNGGDKRPLLITVRGADNATYWDEALQQKLPFPAGEVMHAMVAAKGTGQTLSKNVGITPLTEAAYKYAIGKFGADGWKATANIVAANQVVTDEFNRFLPSTMAIVDITRLPAMARDDLAQVFDGSSANVRYGLVLAGLVRAVNLRNGASPAPGVDLLQQLALDLSDGHIDGIGPGNVPVTAAGRQAYEVASLSADLLVGIQQMAGINAKAQPPLVTYTLAGNISGLTSSGLVLASRGATRVVPANAASFSLGAVLVAGSAYDVRVKTQPNGQTCSISRGAGTTTGDVVDVVVSCVTPPQPKFSIGGVVSGLAGTGLVLQNSGADDLPVAANGATAFATPAASGSAYAVTVKAQPTNPMQTCGVDNAAGTVTANVTNVMVTCITDRFYVGAAVSGLAGSGLVLQNNGGSDLAVIANGSAIFETPVSSGASYAVTVRAQPTNPQQTCVVGNATGTVATNVTTVAVTCTTNTFTISATVSGLAGSGLVLQNNGANNLAVGGNVNSTFTTPVASGAPYGVTVLNQPANPAQICSVANGSGQVAAANVSNVTVTCATILPSTFSLGGSVSGLAGSGLVLQNNGGSSLAVGANGSFTFATPVDDGGAYGVTVQTQPSNPLQICVVSNGSGKVVGAKVTNVAVACTTQTFNVGGVVSGLAGSGLVLINNGGDNLSISADGSFSFSAAVASGNAYNIAVLRQPTNSFQTCTVTNGSGTVNSASVLNVAVSCTRQSVRYAYVVNSRNDTVSTYVVDATTGRLKFIDKAAAGSSPYSIAVHPSQRFVYVANTNGGGNGSVSQYTIGSNGSLAPMKPATVAAGVNANSVNVDPSGKFAYVTNIGGISQYTIGANGNLEPIAGAPTVDVSKASFSIGIHPNGKFVYVLDPAQGVISQYAVGPNGGLKPSPAPTVATGKSPASIKIDSGGKFAYVAESGNTSHYAIASDGSLKPVSTAPAVSAGLSPSAIAIDPSGKFAYRSNYSAGNVSQYAIGANGALTPLATVTVAAGANPQFINVDPSGRFAYSANSGSNDLSLYTIGSDGSLTPNAPVTVAALAGPTSIAFSNGDSPSVSVPKYAYVANSTDNNVSQYTIGTDGGLTHMKAPTVKSESTPVAVVVDPTGRFAYVVNSAPESSSVTQYAVALDGSLTPATVTPIAGRDGRPVAIAIHPIGKFVYVVNAAASRVSQFSVQETGELSPLAVPIETDPSPTAIAVDPSGKFAYVANGGGNSISQYAIGADGVLSAMTVIQTPKPASIAVDPTGKFVYVANSNGGGSDGQTVSQFLIGAKGNLTPMGSWSTGPASSVAVDPSGRFVSVGSSTNALSQYSITSQGTVVGTHLQLIASSETPGADLSSVSIDPSGRFVYAANGGKIDNIWLYAIETSGALKPLTPKAITAGSGAVSITSTGTWK